MKEPLPDAGRNGYRLVEVIGKDKGNGGNDNAVS